MSPRATKAKTPRGAQLSPAPKKLRSAKRSAPTVTKATGKAKKLVVGKANLVSAKGRATRDGADAVPVMPRTLTEFMAQALAMEIEAAQRYGEFADAMETHNNLEVAALFRKMAGIEHKHATQIMAEMGWKEIPAILSEKASWEGFEAPETTPGDEVHYLMQPYHALQLALVNEQRAERFFSRLVHAATVPSVRKAARELHTEEREHVALIRAWIKRVRPPDSDWANDPDPPSYTD